MATGRSRLADSVSWAEDYKGESRSALLTWLGAEAWRRAQRLPITDTERASLLATGLAAEDAAISGEGPHAMGTTLVEAMVYKHLLLTLQAQSLTDPAAREQALRASSRLLSAAQVTFNALEGTALRNQSRGQSSPSGGP